MTECEVRTTVFDLCEEGEFSSDLASRYLNDLSSGFEPDAYKTATRGDILLDVKAYDFWTDWRKTIRSVFTD